MGKYDPEGVVHDPSSGTIFVVADFMGINQYSSDGTLLNSIDTTNIDPMFINPSGITIHPVTGNLLVVDDDEGTRSLYELTIAGDLVDVVDLETEFGFIDPEGVTVDPGTLDLYIAFDDDGRVARFSLPEPSAALFLLIAAGAVTALRRRRD